VSINKKKQYHNGYVFCQHCGCSIEECKKCWKQIGERCCKECENSQLAKRLQKEARKFQKKLTVLLIGEEK